MERLEIHPGLSRLHGGPVRQRGVGRLEGFVSVESDASTMAIALCGLAVAHVVCLGRSPPCEQNATGAPGFAVALFSAQCAA